ncbi:uncharacterized protein PAC_13680 [Phialocephala subalpina]|uniref:Uncharacterized protein n=1 Tax=Phialocephala subalpina TaxID=576137 RepID=A0A1L7XFH6_9HELO|nr:uncharacterized protein PAC_13680 [Phialocephala subalpina]
MMRIFINDEDEVRHLLAIAGPNLTSALGQVAIRSILGNIIATSTKHPAIGSGPVLLLRAIMAWLRAWKTEKEFETGMKEIAAAVVVFATENGIDRTSDDKAWKNPLKPKTKSKKLDVDEVRRALEWFNKKNDKFEKLLKAAQYLDCGSRVNKNEQKAEVVTLIRTYHQFLLDPQTDTTW